MRGASNHLPISCKKDRLFFLQLTPLAELIWTKFMESREIEGCKNLTVDVDGISTHYYEAGSGAPVILIHGGGAGADAWGNWRG